MSKRLVIAAVVAVCGISVVAAGLLFSWRELNRPLNLPEQGLVFEIAPGAALGRVTSNLANRGVIDHPRILNWYARWQGTATNIQAGEYSLAAPLNARDLLAKFVAGDVLLHQFTIVEGWRFDEMLQRLRLHPAIAASNMQAMEIMADLGRAGEHPEGQFLPDTYSFPRGTSDIEFLRIANQALWTQLEQSFRLRNDASVVETPYQGLILASIIEKETALDAERPLMSGVFHARIRRGMRLQADPTVIYGLGANFDGNLTRAQLNADTPYNTYTRAGLPPTPIALAGAASIAAAFTPVDNGALYFVATGLGDGSHVFSRTLEEHNAAVRRFLEQSRNPSP